MNQYPLWKYLLILIVVLVGGLFALPNYYGTDPAIQIVPQRQAEVTEAFEQQVRGLLDSAGLKVQSIERTDTGLLLRFADVDHQLQASELLDGKLGENYTVAVNLASASPDWLEAFGARPMYLGLDLRGGLHFLLEVDTSTVIEQTYQRLRQDARQLIKSRKLGRPRVRVEDGKLVIRYKATDAGVRDEALDALKSELREMSFTTEDSEQWLRIIGKVREKALRDIKRLAVQQNIATLRNRANELGVAEPVIQQQGEDRIVVQLPGVQDSAKAKRILGATATVEFHLEDVEHSLAEAKKGNVPFGSRIYYDREGVDAYLLKKRVVTTGEHITNATAGFDSDSGSPAVFINLDGAGGNAMKRTTKANLKKPMATVFIEYKPQGKGPDGKPLPPKKVEYVINSAVIQGVFSRRFQITGLESSAEAQELALLLRAGALAAPIQFVEERTIGPSLGAESIAQGTESVVVGMILVLVFMAIWYRGFGMVANVALVMNLVLIMAVLSIMQATLTLPGIAGIVLTVGMAVDANVLIFERIREELRNGNTPQASIHAGYAKALETIADANITTLIAAIVLYTFGTGPIKGFAVTLSVGIVTSMFTAIMGTRAIINLFVGGRKIRKLSI
ncbi:MAG TPA: protein translocase subunit SecD [Gammaproteobacteria bacterium]|nr:protein translocase subunit SecD [Gammaproteobacteria bacterium]